jgi:RimJ/RimL family protein N-acetyltransferase
MAGEILLRDVIASDLPVFFENQLDPVANRMAAFTAKDPADREAFMAKWAKILADPGIKLKTVLFEGQIAGSVLSHGWFGDPEVCYWFGRTFWGKGIASRALAEFLVCQKLRPLYARVVKDNAASLRVLEKCGFSICGRDKGFANGRGEEVEEIVLVLRAEAEGEAK